MGDRQISPPSHPSWKGPLGGRKGKVAHIPAHLFRWDNKDAITCITYVFPNETLNSFYLRCEAAGEK